MLDSRSSENPPIDDPVQQECLARDKGSVVRGDSDPVHEAICFLYNGATLRQQPGGRMDLSKHP